jgi:hypothetical protein
MVGWRARLLSRMQTFEFYEVNLNPILMISGRKQQIRFSRERVPGRRNLSC